MKTVVLIGLGPTTLSALESLSRHCHVAAVIRDQASGALSDDEVTKLARDRGIPLETDVTLAGIREVIERHSPDAVVVSSYNRVLPKDLIELSRFVNVHYAALPAYRGRASVNWAIINGEPETAISIHVLVPGLDAGHILHQQRVPIAPDDTVTMLYDKLNEIQRTVLGRTVERYLDGYEGEPQEQSGATYGCTRTPDDGEIDWSAPTSQIYALTRALAAPYPGAFTYLGLRRLHVTQAELLTDPPLYVGRIPGRVVGRSVKNGYVDVLTGDGVLRIRQVRSDDQVIRPAAELITSTKQTLGLRISDLLARLAQLEADVTR